MAAFVLRWVHMRLFALATSFIAMMASLMFLWAHRYQQIPGQAHWQLSDLREHAAQASQFNWAGTTANPTLRLKRNQGEPSQALRLAIPAAASTEALHLRIRLSARGLIPGSEPWETGRITIEWHDPDGLATNELDPIAGIKGDEDSGIMTFVAVPANGPAVPAIRIEHLGRNGELELHLLEMTAVEESAPWRHGKWIIFTLGLIWLSCAISSGLRVKLWRALAAAAVFMAMIVGFVIPGPWKAQRPLFGQDFIIGGAASHPLPSSSAPPPLKIPSGKVIPYGEIVAKDGIAMRIRLLLKPLRPLLHLVLLAAPTLVFALFVGRKRAVLLAVPLALAIELAQAALGYGFDWRDLGDLLFDAAGIACGIWLYGRCHLILKRGSHASSVL